MDITCRFCLLWQRGLTFVRKEGMPCRPFFLVLEMKYGKAFTKKQLLGNSLTPCHYLLLVSCGGDNLKEDRKMGLFHVQLKNKVPFLGTPPITAVFLWSYLVRETEGQTTSCECEICTFLSVYFVACLVGNIGGKIWWRGRELVLSVYPTLHAIINWVLNQSDYCSFNHIFSHILSFKKSEFSQRKTARDIGFYAWLPYNTFTHGKTHYKSVLLTTIQDS